MSSETDKSPSFTFKVLGSQEWNREDDNIDVEITLENGDRYGATFFTIKNLERLFEKNKRTGEFAAGSYLWATDMLIVEELTHAAMNRALHDLVLSGQLSVACSRLEPLTEDS